MKKEKKKSVKIIIIALICSTILIIVTFTCAIVGLGWYILSNLPEDERESMSAMEGLELAQPLINEWNASGLLFEIYTNNEVVAKEKIFLDGRALRWHYCLLDSTSSIKITVPHDKEPWSEISELSEPRTDWPFITNWDLDSTEAIKIINEYQPFKDFANGNSDLRLTFMHLYHLSDSYVWEYEWQKEQQKEHHSMKFFLDVETEEPFYFI